MTIEVTDDSGARDTAQVTIEIKDLVEDEATFSLPVRSDTITWTRIAETQFLMARDQDGVRRPEFELNAQLDPCFKEGDPGEERLHNRTPDWKIYDQYQLDMWWDGNTLKYRDPRRSQEWTGYSITQPDSSLRPGHQRKLPHGIP